MINRDTLLGAALGAGGFYLWQRWEAKKRAAMTFAPPMHPPIGGGRHPGPGNLPFTESGAASAAAAAGLNIEEWEAAGDLLPAEFQVAAQATPNRTHRMGMRPARQNRTNEEFLDHYYGVKAKARRMRGKRIRAGLRRSRLNRPHV